MNTHAAQELATARHHLSDARSILTLGLAPVAAREAYIAAFHAAQAYLYERAARPAKTHRGLRSEFTRLARDEPRLDQSFSRFLAVAYEVKSVADYAELPTVEYCQALGKTRLTP